MVNTSVTLCGIELTNPVIPASGTFGYGHEFADYYDINILGSLSTKGATREPRFGNPTPRIAECAGGMLNSVGLQNPGVDAVISEELPKLARVFHKPVLANVCGFSVDDYARSAAKLDKVPQVGWLEINISCPNVKAGGVLFGQNPLMAGSIVQAVKKNAGSLPVIVKLSPNVTNIAEMAKAIEEAGADMISCINTITGMAVDIRSRKPLLANIVGGLSGPAVKPVALRCVWQVAQTVSIPVIGIGGIASAKDVLEFILVGASAVEIGTASFTDPAAIFKIIQDLPGLCEELGIKNLEQYRNSLITG